MLSSHLNGHCLLYSYTGAELPWQLDLFIKRRSNTTNTKHDWKDVHVIGEHKQSKDDLQALLLQPSRKYW